MRPSSIVSPTSFSRNASYLYSPVSGEPFCGCSASSSQSPRPSPGAASQTASRTTCPSSTIPTSFPLAHCTLKGRLRTPSSFLCDAAKISPRQNVLDKLRRGTDTMTATISRAHRSGPAVVLVPRCFVPRRERRSDVPKPLSSCECPPRTRTMGAMFCPHDVFCLPHRSAQAPETIGKRASPIRLQILAKTYISLLKIGQIDRASPTNPVGD